MKNSNTISFFIGVIFGAVVTFCFFVLLPPQTPTLTQITDKK